MNHSARFVIAAAAVWGVLGMEGTAQAIDGVDEDGGIEAWVLKLEVPPTAEEELADPWNPGLDPYGDLRLHLQGFEGGKTLGVRILLEGDQIGFDGGFSGVLVHEANGGQSARGLLDLQLTFLPIANDRARLRLEGGLGGLFTRCFNAVGPVLGASSEVRLFGPVGLSGAAHWVPWPYRSLDAHLAAQLSFGHYHLRAGVSRVSFDDAGRVGGERHAESFVGPWLGVGIRM